MTKYLHLLLVSISISFTYGQAENPTCPEFRKGIWDQKNSEQKIKIVTLGYDEIPKSLDFRGTVVEALKWTDLSGEKILIQTITGRFDWKDYEKDSTDFMIQDKSEIYAYLFERKKDESTFNRIWKMYDYTECFGVDWFTGFIPEATTITDVDKDGITEICMPYVCICRGGMDPGSMKIMLYEGKEKYALRGSTMLMCESDEPYGGEFTPSENLDKEKQFKQFITDRWNTHKCENGRFYPE